MAGNQIVKQTLQQVKPILSVDAVDARRRVLGLYKAWSRQIPVIVIDYNIPKSEKQCREKLREEFFKHQDQKDVRIIDLLVVKGRMELQEVVNKWKNSHNIMRYWRDTYNPQPKDFLSKFLDGQN